MRLWYLRRAIPWATPAGCLLTAAALALLAQRWESLVAMALPLTALLTLSAAAYVYDEPAVAVTAVTPRGRRWASVVRLVAGACTLTLGLGLLLTAPSPVDSHAWGLLLAGAGGLVLLAGLVSTRRQVPRPGAAIAPVVVLVGLTPLVLDTLLDVHSPYPTPGFTDGVTALWAGAATIGWLGALLLVHGPLGRARGATAPDLAAPALPEPGARR